MTSSTSSIPYRQIRASYDDKTITVYQAYSATIASAAVREQKLHASPDFKIARMTWIKPSWFWMMSSPCILLQNEQLISSRYRSGYSTKDARQSRILALKMTHENFCKLLEQAAVTDGDGDALTGEERKRPVRVQWDPERGPRLGPLQYRSIQIGIGQGICRKWVEEWVVSIEDVTEMALGLKEVVEKEKGIRVEELVERGLMPLQRVYEVSDELRRILRMDD